MDSNNSTGDIRDVFLDQRREDAPGCICEMWWLRVWTTRPGFSRWLNAPSPIVSSETSHKSAFVLVGNDAWPAMLANEMSRSVETLKENYLLTPTNMNQYTWQ